MNLLLRDQLAEIFAEELPANPNFELFGFGESQPNILPAVLQSPRARAVRRIAEIANNRGWQIEVTRTLDAGRANYVDDLSDDAVFRLRDRMEYFEDCVQHGCDIEDAPPAR
jgi:hypothetical protein